MPNKFLSIPIVKEDKGTLVPIGNQLVRSNDVKLVTKGNDQKVNIMYGGGRQIVITHSADTTLGMRNAIQDSIVSSLQTNWRNVSLQLDLLPKPITSITII